MGETQNVDKSLPALKYFCLKPAEILDSLKSVDYSNSANPKMFLNILFRFHILFAVILRTSHHFWKEDIHNTDSY